MTILYSEQKRVYAEAKFTSVSSVLNQRLEEKC